MERAPLDHGEIGDGRPHLELVLHPAEEVEVGRVVLEDAGGAVRPAVVHDHVHRVPHEIGLRLRHLHQHRHLGIGPRLLSRPLEIVEIRQHVLPDLVQVGVQLHVPLVFFPDLLESIPQDVQRRAALQVREGPLGLLVLVLHDADDVLEALLDLLAVLPHLLLLLVIEGLVLLFLDRLPRGVHRDDVVAVHRPVDLEAPGLGLLLELPEELLLHVLETLHDPVLLLVVLLGVEYFRDRDPQVGDQLGHVALEIDAVARRQGKGHRFLGLPEIVDIYPVERHGLRLRLFRDEVAHRRGLSRPVLAQGVDVEPETPHVQAEVDGLEGPLLPDETGQRGNLLRRAEPESGGIAEKAYFFIRQCPGHVGSWKWDVLSPEAI